MTPEQIAELEALAEKATPGPWVRSNDPKKWVSSLAPVTSQEWRDNVENDAALIATLVNSLPAILAALKAQPPASGSDWFAGDVDCDGNELVTLRADELQKLRDDREKFMWQVRDTCARAEMAEAALKAQQPDDAMVRDAIYQLAYHQQQADMDGCMVTVSGQALDEVLVAIAAMQESRDAED